MTSIDMFVDDVVIFIPAYNAEKTLQQTIERIPKELYKKLARIIIVNDGSQDDTALLCDKIANGNSIIEIISYDKNGGYGTAVKHGINASLKSNARYIVCLHADGQYPPEKIIEFVKYMQDQNLHLLQGSRHADGGALSGGMPFYKWLAGKMLVMIENLVFGLRMTDYHSGFMFYDKNIFETIDHNDFSHSFEFDLQMIAAARSHQYKIGEKSIPTHYGDEVSYLNPITYGFRVLKVLFDYLKGRFKP